MDKLSPVPAHQFQRPLTFTEYVDAVIKDPRAYVRSTSKPVDAVIKDPEEISPIGNPIAAAKANILRVIEQINEQEPLQSSLDLYDFVVQ